jgi:cellulose biosynthesis protein BcsQ
MHTITFYSFKGGVGRTMAMVNCAVELMSRGKRVLIVDFDLEAPGLKAFSWLRLHENSSGIVDYVSNYLKSGVSPDISDYVYESNLPDSFKGKLAIMPAGKSDAGYASRLNAINWQDLYDKHDGYLMFEDMKEQWKNDVRPDYVLIDSRTGHTDVGGICTRQLPDSVCIMFLPNKQNLDGLVKVVQDIRSQNEDLEEKKIRLHFAMSNVPDIDDEEQILERWVSVFKSKLDYTEALTIHHYASLSLLNQDIFTATRPHSKLAKEYKLLVDALVRDNPEDRVGALNFLRDQSQRAELSSPEIGISAKELEARLNSIRAIHTSDGEILYRLAIIRHRQGRIREALSLITKSIENDYHHSWAFLRRSDLYSILGENQEALQDLTRALNSTDLSYHQANRALRKLWALDNTALEKHIDSRGLKVLSIDDQVQLFENLRWSKEALSFSEQLLRNLVALDEPKSPKFFHEMFNFNLAFCLIGLRRYAEAMQTLGTPTSDSRIPHVFNYAMAKWAEFGEAPIDLFERVCVLDKQRTFRENANYLQCMGIANWACGRNDMALEYLRKSRELIRGRSEPSISALRFLEVDAQEFLADLDLLETQVSKGSLYCPLELRKESSQPSLFIKA